MTVSPTASVAALELVDNGVLQPPRYVLVLLLHCELQRGEPGSVRREHRAPPAGRVAQCDAIANGYSTRAGMQIDLITSSCTQPRSPLRLHQLHQQTKRTEKKSPTPSERSERQRKRHAGATRPKQAACSAVQPSTLHCGRKLAPRSSSSVPHDTWPETIAQCRAVRPGRRRREFCHFTDIPSPSVLKHLLKGEGGTAE